MNTKMLHEAILRISPENKETTVSDLLRNVASMIDNDKGIPLDLAGLIALLTSILGEIVGHGETLTLAILLGEIELRHLALKK